MGGHRSFASKITTIMRSHVLISLLLVCAAAAFPAADENENLLASLKLSEPLSSNYALDDEDVLPEIDLDADDSETEEETLRDLHNRVFFYLHTRPNPQEAQPIYIGDSQTLVKTRFDPKKPTKFIAHGWMNTRNSAVSTLIRDAYLRHGDYNVIVVDWGKISLKPYLWVTRRVQMVGEYVAKMIDFLEAHKQDTSKISLVGHSLGAHVAGLAAYNAHARITYLVGLDPALPGFALAGVGERISTADADYVEIIHTNAGLLGYLSPIGHVDFYPNGGSRQSGCSIDAGGACSHARSYRFFAESINSQVGFHGVECSSYVTFKLGICKGEKTLHMGGIKKKTHFRGTYYLSTHGKPPYAKGL